MKPRPIFIDMPLHIKKDIVNFIDPFTKLNFRLCSKLTKKLVDASPTRYEMLWIQVYDPSIFHIILQIDRAHVLSRIIMNDPEKIARGITIIDEAAQFIAKVLSKPNFAVGQLFFDIGVLERRADFMAKLGNLVAALPQKLNVHQYGYRGMETEEDVLYLLPHLKPGILRSVILETSPQRQRVSLSLTNLSSLECWKSIKFFRTSVFDVRLDFSKLKHFENLCTNFRRLTLELVRTIIANFLENPETLRCALAFYTCEEAIADYLLQFPLHGEKRRIAIPDTTNYLEVSLMLEQHKFYVIRNTYWTSSVYRP